MYDMHITGTHTTFYSLALGPLHHFPACINFGHPHPSFKGGTKQLWETLYPQ